MQRLWNSRQAGREAIGDLLRSLGTQQTSDAIKQISIMVEEIIHDIVLQAVHVCGSGPSLTLKHVEIVLSIEETVRDFCGLTAVFRQFNNRICSFLQQFATQEGYSHHLRATISQFVHSSCAQHISNMLQFSSSSQALQIALSMSIVRNVFQKACHLLVNLNPMDEPVCRTQMPDVLWRHLGIVTTKF